MLLVILGAGASYDSIPAKRLDAREWARHPARPPLADQLFEPRPKFLEALSVFPRIAPIVPYLQQRPEGESVETVLQRLRDEADRYPERIVQLAAVRYYLQRVVWQCTNEWYGMSAGATNFATLLDQIQSWRRPQDQVGIVTFNYDRLLELALERQHGWQFNSVADYVNRDDVRVFKVHGSVDWGIKVSSPVHNVSGRPEQDLVEELISRAASLELSKEHYIVQQLPTVRLGSEALVPSLSIPVQQKSEFACPSEHMEALEAWLPGVRRILVVGWKAEDRQFMELLAACLKGVRVRVHVVAKDIGSANDTITRIKHAGFNGKFTPSPLGFSDFVTRRAGEEFLSSRP
jgi:hypothetical protein